MSARDPAPANSISAEGKARAEAELEQLREVRRPEIVAAIKAAREHGDLSENAEYHAAREEQGLNEARIRFLEHHLATAMVQAPRGGEEAGVGSLVSFRDDSDGETKEVTLVHPLEVSVAEGKISVESPIGEALLGARAGEKVGLSTPRGEKQLQIFAVS